MERYKTDVHVEALGRAADDELAQEVELLLALLPRRLQAQDVRRDLATHGRAGGCLGQVMRIQLPANSLPGKRTFLMSDFMRS